MKRLIKTETIIVIILLLVTLYMNRNYQRFSKLSTINIDYTSLMYDLYVDYYLEFPKSEEEFKQFYILTVLQMGQTVEFVKGNPLIDFSIQFTRYNDGDSIPRIRATLSKKPRNQDDLIKNAVPLEDYNFIHYLTNSKAIILFDYPAYKCNASRRLMIFHGTEPNRCFDEKAKKVTWILKGFYKGYNELIDLAQGWQSSCYHIRATKQDSTFAFSIECLPQDSAWIDQKGLDMLLDSLAKSFAIPELEYVDHFFFPLIAKNSTLQEGMNSKNHK
jgi:hypothetical protein